MIVVVSTAQLANVDVLRNIRHAVIVDTYLRRDTEICPIHHIPSHSDSKRRIDQKVSISYKRPCNGKQRGNLA
jgi:hypothetical protein